MRIALYFGSFNPMHIGHVAICKYLIGCSDIDQVRLIVSPQNPLKADLSDNGGIERLKHVREVVAEMGEGITVSDIEFTLPKPLYTINTLRKFSELEPDNKLILIIGADNLFILEKWKCWRKILDEYEVWVYPRTGFDGPALCRKYKLPLIGAPTVDVSSSQIREGEEAGIDLSCLKV